MTRQSAFFVAMAIASASSTIGASRSVRQSPSPTPTPKTFTISGCVDDEPAGPDRYKLTDSTDGTTYRLSGSDVRKFVGRRVQLTGGLESKRLHIAGGLLPSPNVAGQAGAMDPTQAAQASSTAGVGTANASLPTFRVARVRALSEPCSERPK